MSEVITREDHMKWLMSHGKSRNRILLAGASAHDAGFYVSAHTEGQVIGCDDFGWSNTVMDQFVNLMACDVYTRFASNCVEQILSRKLTLHFTRLHETPDEKLGSGFDMFVLNQTYGSADDAVDAAARDIQRGISLCQPAALICGTCYSNPATQEAVDKLIPFRQLFGNIWFGYL